MAKGKLKASLAAHQHNASLAARKKAREAAEKAKKSSQKHSTAEKRNLKRQRQAVRDREAELASRKAEREAQARAERLARETAEDDEDEADGAGAAMDTDEQTDFFELARDSLTASDRAFAERATVPIALDDTVLLLGEANFSFARALVESRGHAGHLICATCYDSEATTYEKYPDAKANVAYLISAGVRVGFGVDAGALSRAPANKIVGKGKRWSRVVFNFPHTGAGITDQDRNVLDNQKMLLRAFAAVAPLLTEGPSAFPLVTGKGKKGGNAKVQLARSKVRGKANAWAAGQRAKEKDDSSDEEVEDEQGGLEDDEGNPIATPAVFVPSSFTPPLRQGTFLITLLAQAPYTLWGLSKLATKPPPLVPGTRDPQPRYRLLRSFEFCPAAYPGYAHRRTIGWRAGLSKAANEEIVGRTGKARTSEFCVWDGPEDSYAS